MFHDIAACDEIVYSALLSPGSTSSLATRRLLQKDGRCATSQLLVARCRHFKSIKVANNFMRLWPLCYRYATDLIGYRVPTETSKRKQTDSKTMMPTMLVSERTPTCKNWQRYLLFSERSHSNFLRFFLEGALDKLVL